MNRKIFIVSIIIFILDQVVKSVISSIMSLEQSVIVIKNFFYITFFHNYGASWGILKGYSWLIIGITLIALVLIYRYMYSFKNNKRNMIAFGLLTGGIIGNLVDRIFLGYVVDFFDFTIFGYNFPIFNVADMGIVIGVFLLVIAILKGEDKFGKNSSKTK